MSIYEPDYKVTKEEIEFLKSIPTTTDLRSKVNLSENDIINLKELKSIKDVMFEVAKRYAEDVLGISNELAPLHSWIAKQEKGGQHLMHDHPNVLFNLVYYIEGADNNTLRLQLETGKSRLHEGFNFYYKSKKNTAMNSSSAGILPKNGQIICIPGWLIHGTDISKGPRLCIGWNFFVKGSLDGTPTDVDMNINLSTRLDNDK